MDAIEFNSEAKKWVLKKHVDKWREEFKNDNKYNEYCKVFRQNGITDDIDIETIKHFLHDWGMRRVLGRNKYKDWEAGVKTLIKANREKLDELRKTDLIKITQATLQQYKPEIKRYYCSFAGVLGPIAAAKTLHLLCSDFFPLWDNAIAAAFRKERTEKISKFSAEDYYEFMKDIKNSAEKYDSTISLLAKKYNAHRLRIIDRFAVSITRRPLSLLF